jgi:hypothetical protein
MLEDDNPLQNALIAREILARPPLSKLAENMEDFVEAGIGPQSNVRAHNAQEMLRGNRIGLILPPHFEDKYRRAPEYFDTFRTTHIGEMVFDALNVILPQEKFTVGTLWGNTGRGRDALGEMIVMTKTQYKKLAVHALKILADPDKGAEFLAISPTEEFTAARNYEAQLSGDGFAKKIVENLVAHASLTAQEKAEINTLGKGNVAFMQLFTALLNEQKNSRGR